MISKLADWFAADKIAAVVCPEPFVTIFDFDPVWTNSTLKSAELLTAPTSVVADKVLETAE